MKSKKELNDLKEEFKTLKGKLEELAEEELVQVTGGTGFVIDQLQVEDEGKYVTGD